jgi:hypothetical protein
MAGATPQYRDLSFKASAAIQAAYASQRASGAMSEQLAAEAVAACHAARSQLKPGHPLRDDWADHILTLQAPGRAS